MPKSPCSASAGWTKKAGVPVLASDAAIFLPMCPDFPIPDTTALPVQLSNKWQAWTKCSSNRVSSRGASSISISSVSRAKYSSDLFIFLSHKNDTNTVFFDCLTVLFADAAVSDQGIDTGKVTHNIGAFTAKF